MFLLEVLLLLEEFLEEFLLWVEALLTLSSDNEAQWRLSLGSGLLDSLLPRDICLLELCEDSPMF